MKYSFIDFIKIFCKSGNGGNGSYHFSKIRNATKTIPNGGSGGKGGDIIIIGNSQFRTLFHLRYQKHWIAKTGFSGGKNKKTGANGSNLLIEVPLGTIIRDSNNNILTEITKNFQKKILFRGGKGGKGNAFIKKSKYEFYSNIGTKTTGKWIFLELKMLSDIGLIGEPNVGKSTLLSVLTKAKPKIGNYPFSNKIPYLGVIKYNFDSLSIADIPGIVKNASKGKGLGLHFLRHIERNSILLFLISSEFNNKKKRYLDLINELKKFNPILLNKKHLLVISKSDLINYDTKKKIIQEFLNQNIIFISSFTKEGLKILKEKLWKLVYE